MSTFEEVRNLVWPHAAKHIESVEQITIDSDLMFDVGLDSLDKVQFALDCEDYFNHEITDEEVSQLKTVGDVVRLIDSKRPA